MANDLDLTLRIAAEASQPQAQLRQLGNELRALGEEAGLSEQEMQALSDEIARVAKEQGLIDNFRRQKKAITEAEQAMQAAKQRAQELGRELARTENPSKRLQNTFERARQEARRSAESYRNQRERLQRLRDAMRQAGVSTTNLADHQRQLRQHTEQLRGQIDRLRQSVRQADQAGSRFGSVFSQRLGSISDTLRRTRSDLLAFVAAHAGIDFAKQLADTADQWASISARIKQATDSEAEFNQVQAELFRLSQETRSSLAANSALYARIADSIKRMGGTAQDAISVTETLTKLLQLQGATSEEVASATLQFSQAIASGVLRGEEFNAVYEASPKAIEALANGLGVPVEKMRALAEAGELTADRVIGGLLRQKQAVDQAYAELPLTVGGALQQLENQWLKLIGTQDQAAGASRQVAEAIQLFADNLDAVLATAVTVGNAATIAARTVVLAVTNLAAQVANALDTLTFGAIDALHIRAQALTDTVKAIAGDVVQDFKDIETAWEGVGKAAQTTNQQIAASSEEAATGLKKTGEAAAQAGIEFERIAPKTATIDDALKKLGVDATQTSLGLRQSFVELVGAFDQLAQSGETSADVLQAAADKLLSQAQTADELAAALTRLGQAQQGITLSTEQQAQQYAAILQHLNALSAAERQRVASQSKLAQSALQYAENQQAAIEADIRAAGSKEALAQVEERLNRLVADGILTAQQAATASQQLADATQAMADQQRAAAEAVAQTANAQADAAATADRLKTSTQGAAQAADGFAQAMGGVVDAINAFVMDMGPKATARFEQLLGVNLGLAEKMAQSEDRLASLNAALQRNQAIMRHNASVVADLTGSLGDYNDAALRTRQEYLQQAIAAERLTQQLQRAGGANAQLIQHARQAADSFDLLDNASLERLKQAIQAADDQLQRLRQQADQAKAALDGLANNLRDELDRLENNRAAIEERRYRQQLERIAELERKGGEAARREAEEARRLADELHKRKLAQIKQEAEERARRQIQQPRGGTTTTAAAPPPALRVEKVIRVDFGGRSLDVPASQEKDLLALLERFKRVS